MCFEPLEGAVVFLKTFLEQLGLQIVHQAPINAPAQSQMEQNNSALPLTIQMTPLGILGSLIAINSFTWCWTICAVLA